MAHAAAPIPFLDERRIEQAKPILEALLLPAAQADELVVALADTSGTLRFLSGAPTARRRADAIEFAVGANWSPQRAGHNAPGIAVTSAQAVSVRREQHTRPDVRSFSCSAAPLLSRTGDVLGALDVTGGDSAGDPRVLDLVRACAAAIQREWMLVDHADALESRHRRGDPAPTPRLRLLGRVRPSLDIANRSYPLTERHTELLTALATSPQGLTTEELLDTCYHPGASASTARVEMLRLRRWLDQIPGAPRLTSRPYRLSCEVQVDAIQVLDHLRSGEHEAALDLFHAPLAPRCDRHAGELIQSTAAALREAILADAEADALLAYLQLPQAQNDSSAWRLALKILPPAAPQRALVVSHLEKLSTEEG